VIPKSSSFSKVDNCVQRVVDAIQNNLIEPLDFELAEKLTETLGRMFDAILAKVEKDGIDVSQLIKYERQLFMMIVAAFGVFNIHSLFKKEASERNRELKQSCIELFKKFDQVLDAAKKTPEDGDKSNVLQKWLPLVFYNISSSIVVEWSMQEQYLRV